MTALLTLQFISKTTIATKLTTILGIYIYSGISYRERKIFSKPLNTHWNLKWPKYGAQTLARDQGDKVSNFCSIYALYFRLQNTFVNSYTNRNDLRHCVTLIVTSKYKGQTKVIELRLPVMYAVDIACIQCFCC